MDLMVLLITETLIVVVYIHNDNITL